MTRQWHTIRSTVSESVPRRCLFIYVAPVVDNTDPLCTAHAHQFGIAAVSCCTLSDGKLISRDEGVLRSPVEVLQWLEKNQSRRGSTWIFASKLHYALTLIRWWHGYLGAEAQYVWGTIGDSPEIVVTSRYGRRSIYVAVENYLGALSGYCTQSRTCAATPAPGVASVSESDVQSCRQCLYSTEGAILGIISIYASERMGKWGPTAAALAWSNYRHCYVGDKIYCHSHARASLLERQAIRGGWNAVFNYGYVPEKTTISDCNSMYGWAMASMPLPTKLVAYSELLTVGDLSRDMRSYGLVASVGMRAENSVLRAHRLCLNGAPTKDHETILCGAELDKALSMCLVTRVYRSALYEMGWPLLEYANAVYRRRLACRSSGDTAGEALAKLMLNSIHGKFGQRGRRWVRSTCRRLPDWYDFWWERPPGSNTPVRHRCIAGVVERMADGPAPQHSFPALPAYIMAACRDRLCSVIDICGAPNVRYCDTDSVHTNDDGDARLVHGALVSEDEMGKFRRVYNGETAYYHGPKCYRVGERLVCGWADSPAVLLSDGSLRRTTHPPIACSLSTATAGRILVRRRKVSISPGLATMYKGVTGG